MLIKQTKESLYMNETAIVYIVHSDLDENNIFAMFEDEVEAIMYARRHKEDLTYVDRTEMTLDDSGDYDEVLSAETIWVYDEDVDPEDIEDEYDICARELPDKIPGEFVKMDGFVFNAYTKFDEWAELVRKIISNK